MIDAFHKFILPTLLGAQRIVYGPALAANLKALSFTLKDSASCNALYDTAGLAALDQAQLVLMQTYRDQAIQEKDNDDAVTMPEIDVPKFTTDNYDDFMAKFLTVVSRTKGVHGVSIVKLMETSMISIQLES